MSVCLSVCACITRKLHGRSYKLTKFSVQLPVAVARCGFVVGISNGCAMEFVHKCVRAIDAETQKYILRSMLLEIYIIKIAQSPFMIFAVFDAWLLTQWISCSFLNLYLLF